MKILEANAPPPAMGQVARATKPPRLRFSTFFGLGVPIAPVRVLGDLLVVSFHKRLVQERVREGARLTTCPHGDAACQRQFVSLDFG